VDVSILLRLLLPVAAASGWFAARRADGRAARRDGRVTLSSEYFKGINYLLNEQPDKAIDVFIKVLEVDSETVETHLALGNLYRRRGEVDRAIRIHQNLVARSTISDEQRYEALLELSQDYLSAGLLDRAENLFRELVDAGRHSVQALRQLIDIYEQERDWDKAVTCARELERVTGSDLGNVVSQYYCEQAELVGAGGNVDEALTLLRSARQAHGACVRASIIEGELLTREEDFEGAVKAFQRVEQQDSDYVPEIVGRTLECLSALKNPSRVRAYLADVYERHGGMTAMLALSELTRRDEGDAAAIDFVREQLRARPTLRGFERLLELESFGNVGAAQAASPAHWSILQSLTSSLMEGRPVYQCQHCGFPARLLHWRCPGCKHWSSVRPIHGVEGE
jgi:lipopolysaccharide biosynthesis regulator YciM